MYLDSDSNENSCELENINFSMVDGADCLNQLQVNIGTIFEDEDGVEMNNFPAKLKNLKEFNIQTELSYNSGLVWESWEIDSLQNKIRIF